MLTSDKLYILRTNADIVTSEKMVFMYATNSKLKYWWKDVNLVIGLIPIQWGV